MSIYFNLFLKYLREKYIFEFAIAIDIYFIRQKSIFQLLPLLYVTFCVCCGRGGAGSDMTMDRDEHCAASAADLWYLHTKQ